LFNYHIILQRREEILVEMVSKIAIEVDLGAPLAALRLTSFSFLLFLLAHLYQYI